MSDETVIVMNDGGRWRPSTSKDMIQCHHCDNLVDTPEEIASYPDGECPDCGNPWTAETKRHTSITVTAPEPISGSSLGG